MKLATLTVGAIALIALTACTTGPSEKPASETNYPTKTIKYVVPYAAGGPADLNSRALMTCVGEEVGQTVVIENYDGGGGAVGTQSLIAADPDGYTIGYGSNGTVIINPLANSLGFGLEDLTPIAGLTEVPAMIVVNASSKYSDADTFFDAIKAAPNSVTIAVPGATSSMGIELQRMAELYEVVPIVVPAAGSAQMTTDLLGGHVDAIFINDDPTIQSRIKDGSFRALSVSTAERLEAYPDIPTLAEAGFPELTYGTTVPGIFGPAGIDPAAIETLQDAVGVCLDDASVREQIGERFVSFRTTDEITGVYDEMLELYSNVFKTLK